MVQLEHARIHTVATYLYLFGYTVPLAVTSILAYQRGEYTLGAMLAVFALSAALVLVRVIRRGLDLRVRVIMVVATCLLFLYLALSGGYAGTGLFWCYALLVVINHFSTAVVGLVACLSLIVATGFVLSMPSLAWTHPDYGLAVTNRFLLTAGITSILLFMWAMLQETLTARLKEVQQQLLQTSMTDELTGLTNRRSMNEALRQQERRDLGDRMLAVVIADVDRFKHINDTLGHDAGDRILQHIARVLRDSLRSSDRVARWGGEEFLILLDVLDAEEAATVVERLRAALEQGPVNYQGRIVHSTASFGVKVITDSGTRLQGAVVEADVNLLRAKEQGRNCVVVS